MSHSIPSQPTRLALSDGTVFTGRGFGACDADQTVTGEVVFNTAMTGYQEALSDPSYAEQILVMTAPMIGNYGVSEEDVESSRPQVAGFVVRELSRLRSNYRSTMGLSDWLAQHGVPGIAGIDTRALVRRLRSGGAMEGVLSSDQSRTDEELVKRAQTTLAMAGRNLAAQTGADESGNWSENLGAWRFAAARGDNKTFRVLALDCGAKHNIYRHLTELGCSVQIAPHDMSAENIRDLQPDGLFISNGPGDPAAVTETIDILRTVAGGFPTFGICLGHQLLSLALGAETYKLKFGHRGANQPVRNVLTGQVEITSQNHGFCVDDRSLKNARGETTHIHLNDNTVAGFRHLDKPIFAVQYHPEASPGPHDSAYLFDSFLEMMRSGEPVTADVMRKSQQLYRQAATI